MEAAKFKKGDITDQNCVKKGPPKTYKIVGNWEGKTIFVKEYNDKESVDKMEECWKDFKDKGIPIPAYGTLKLGDKYYFWTEKCVGDRFFKVSKNAKIITTWLKSHTQVEYLNDLLEIFRKHNRGDVQGCFEDHPDGKIEFIDLANPVVAVPQLWQFIPTIETQIKKLEAEAKAKAKAKAGA